jgi:hypothetical protein
MRKLKLDMEQFELTSFQTVEIHPQPGTVGAHDMPTPTLETSAGCEWTNDNSCVNSCIPNRCPGWVATAMTAECGCPPETTP